MKSERRLSTARGETTPWLTKGKTSVEIKLRSMGSLFAYGKPWDYDTYQHKLTRPTRESYRLYAHTNPALSTGAEVQGTPPDYSHAPVRRAPDEQAELEKRKEDANHYLHNLLSRRSQQHHPHRVRVRLLARAAHHRIAWVTPVCHFLALRTSPLAGDCGCFFLEFLQNGGRLPSTGRRLARPSMNVSPGALLPPGIVSRQKRHLLRKTTLAAAWMLLGAGHPASAAASSAILDTLPFGQPSQEQAHQLVADHSDVAPGLLGESTRRLLPLDATSWQGGKLAFTMKVDPVKITYFTVRLSGSDRNSNRLILYCEGKQVGYRHLGDIDLLDSPNGAPGFNGRFFYTTNPLPLDMTRGNSELHFEIRATGDIYGYANQFDKYQKPFKDASRGIYRAYTHTEGCFVPPPEEKQGAAPGDLPVRRSPGPEVIDAARERVNKEVRDLLAARTPIDQIQLWFLARAYAARAVPAEDNARLTIRALETLDRLYVAFRANPKIAYAEPSLYNSDWFGIGPAAQTVVLLAPLLKSAFDQPVSGAPGTQRRAGWTEMFVACRDWHRENRRQYTNQSMISDTYGLYLANRGVAMLDPSKALPEARALRYLYESAGLEPWLGSEKDGVPSRSLGDHYFQLTDRGLTKELGFVGYYGEVLDWMTAMYEATRPALDQPGDPRLLAQLVKAAKARAVFRHPALDDDGNRAMRAETIVGWRDQGHYPGDVTYQERPTWDASAILSAAATLDPALAGYAQQMFADNQFFATVADQLKTSGLRQTAGMLAVPGDYERLHKLAPSASRLPMTPGQPDFAWADEEDGVLAVKHGDEILYVSLYWRARSAINFLARVHYITPRVDHIAVVHEDEQFEPSGEFWTRPDWVNMGFGNGGLRYPGDLHSAETGEKLPIAKIPDRVKFRVGDESPYAGRASFYQLRYGPYLIGMNASADRSYALMPPQGLGVASAPDLVSGKPLPLTATVAPHSTVVLYLGQTN